MPITKLGSKGQLKLPKDVRKALGLNQGDQAEIIITNKNEAILRSASIKTDEVFGMLKEYGQKPVSIESMKEGIKKRIKDHFE